MRNVLLLGFVVGLASQALAGVDNDDQENFEGFDVENMLEDKDQVNEAFACLMDQSPCGKYQMLRDTIPTLIETNCSLCSPKQKEKFDRTIKLFVEKYPEKNKALMLKYSPKTNK